LRGARGSLIFGTLVLTEELHETPLVCLAIASENRLRLPALARDRLRLLDEIAAKDAVVF